MDWPNSADLRTANESNKLSSVKRTRIRVRHNYRKLSKSGYVDEIYGQRVFAAGDEFNEGNEGDVQFRTMADPSLKPKPIKIRVAKLGTRSGRSVGSFSAESI